MSGLPVRFSALANGFSFIWGGRVLLHVGEVASQAAANRSVSVTSCDRRSHRRFDPGPVEHHLAVAEPEHPVSESAQAGVAMAVRFEMLGIRMELCAIHLDHESLAKEEINAANPVCKRAQS